MLIKFSKFIHHNLSLLLLLAIVIIPFSALSYFLLYDNVVSRQNEGASKNVAMAQILASNLDSYLLDVENGLQNFGPKVYIEKYNRAQLDNILANMHLVHNEISLYWITDKSGRIIAKYPDVFPDKSAAGKDFFLAAMTGKNFVSDRITGEMSGLQIIVVSEPYFDKYGHPIGAIGASIPLSVLQKKLNVPANSSSYPILVSKSGKFLVHPDLENIQNKVQRNDPIWQALKRKSSGTLDIVAPYDGKRKIFSWASMNQSNWVVIEIQPLTNFEAEINQLFVRNALVIFLLLLVVVLAARQFVLLRHREEETRLAQAEKLAAVGELAAGMAHEIRNPLTAIKGFIQLIEQHPKDTVPQDYLTTILREINRIEGIVSEALVLAKPTPISFIQVNLVELIREVYTLMQPQAMLQHVTFTCICADNLPPVTAEPNHLKQVLINLIKNSLEAIQPNRGSIQLKATWHSSTIVIRLSDTGCGIPQDILTRLGDPFLTTKDQGTGLGLMITYRIVQNHGGSIHVTSRPGQGTTVTIRLPLDGPAAKGCKQSRPVLRY